MQKVKNALTYGWNYESLANAQAAHGRLGVGLNTMTPSLGGRVGGAAGPSKIPIIAAAGHEWAGSGYKDGLRGRNNLYCI
jgi:hypothetical protein